MRELNPETEIQDCYLKNIFPNKLSNTFSDFIWDMEVTVTDTMVTYTKYNRESSPSRMLFNK